MSNQCKIVEDLLPLYHDGVCSKESRQLVDDHLTQCESCRKMLDQIDGELIYFGTKDTDITPLEGINRAVKQGKKKALIAGISIAIAVVLVLFAGVSIWWYTQEYTYYVPFTVGQEPNSVYEYNEDGSIKQAVVVDAGRYTWYDDQYRYEVEIPSFLSRSGSVTMTPLNNSEKQNICINITRWKGTQYVFHVNFSGDEHNWYNENGGINWPSFIVDSDMNQYYLDHWTDEIIEEHNTLLIEYTDEVQKIIDDAIAMWPFIK